MGGIWPNLGYSSLGSHVRFNPSSPGARSFGIGLCEQEVHSRGTARGQCVCATVTLLHTYLWAVTSGPLSQARPVADAGDAMWQSKAAVSGIELQSLGLLISVLCSSWQSLKVCIYCLSVCPHPLCHTCTWAVGGRLCSHFPFHSLCDPGLNSVTRLLQQAFPM